jgi:hypothetical protein
MPPRDREEDRMTRRGSVATTLIVVCILLVAQVKGARFTAARAAHTGHTAHKAAQAGQQPVGAFQVVGHSALLGRGMNAALAVAGRYAYVGSRTDGSAGHPHAGVLVVDIARPASPRVVGEIGPPDEGNRGETARELRVWPAQHLLIVANFACSPLLHGCAQGVAVAPTFRFYDIAGRDAASPRLVDTYYPSRLPHEFYLWADPRRPGRALLYISTPYLGRAGDQLLVADISRARAGLVREVASWRAEIPDPEAYAYLHSLSLSPDGRRAYLAYLGGGVLVANTSDVARALPRPAVRLITPVEDRAHWGNPGAHSAVKLPGRPYVFVTDEVYGTFAGLYGAQGCPWGWARVLDVRDERRPVVVAQYKLVTYNSAGYCSSVPQDREQFASYSSHNPTLTAHLAFVSWHSGGLQAIDLADPLRPRQTAQFLPAPLPAVATEDPALSAGRDKVVMWSYPIVEDGLILVVDVRNGLYILKYHGPHEAEVAAIRFLEGNSNLGDAGS